MADSQRVNKVDYRLQLLGGALVFLGAIFFSSKAVIVKLAYQYPVDSISLLTLRFLFALPVYLLIHAFSKKSRRKYGPISRRDGWKVLLYGILGYYLASLLDFLGLQYITASMERLILFLYPTIVVLASAFFFRARITRAQILALLLTYIGIGMAFWEGLHLSGQENFALGGLLVFLCSICYAFYLLGSGELIPRLGTIRFTTMALTASSITVLLHHLIFYQWDLFGFPGQVYALAILMALVATVLPTFLVSEGIRLIGASNASIVGSVGPISTIVLAYIFLEERLGVLQLIGTVIVISGVLLVSLQRQR